MYSSSSLGLYGFPGGRSKTKSEPQVRPVLPAFVPFRRARFHGGTARDAFLPLIRCDLSADGRGGGVELPADGGLLDVVASLPEPKSPVESTRAQLNEVIKKIDDNLANKKKTRDELRKADDALLANNLSTDENARLRREIKRLEDEANDYELEQGNLKLQRDELVGIIAGQEEAKKQGKLEADTRSAAREAALLAFRPMETMLRRDGKYNELAPPRMPAAILAPKPTYDPAMSDPGATFDRTHLTVSSWYYLMRGVVLPKLRSPAIQGAGTKSGADHTGPASENVDIQLGRDAEHVAATAGLDDAHEGAIAPKMEDVRSIGAVSSTSGCGKTHLAMDVWHAGNKLDQPLYADIAHAAGISDTTWSCIARQAKATPICCVNWNGLTSWGWEDEDMVKTSLWYEELYVKDVKKPVDDGAGHAGVDVPVDGPSAGVDGPSAGVDGACSDGSGTYGADAIKSTAEGAGSGVAGIAAACADGSVSDVVGVHKAVADGAVADGVGALSVGAAVYIKDAHLLPLYLRVLWCLMYQAAVSYSRFAQSAWEEVRAGRIPVASVVAEARGIMQQGRVAILVDELTMATVARHDRRLCELYRHILCTFTNRGFAGIVFFSLSFMFVLDEIIPAPVTKALTAPGGKLPRAKLSTPGSMGEGSPWSVAIVGTLTMPAFDELLQKLLPVAQSRAFYTVRSVEGSHEVAAEEAASALARVSGGHLRSFKFLLNGVRDSEDDVLLWDVVVRACRDTGMTPSIFNLLLQAACFPSLLLAGLVSCTVEGSSVLIPAPGFLPADDYCVIWDDAFSNNLLSGSPNNQGRFENPSFLTAFLLVLTAQWNAVVATLAMQKQDVNPEVSSIMTACARFVSAARIVDPGRAWEVTTYWSEVVLSRVRHAAAKYLVDAPGVADVVDYSRIAVRDLYKGNLEQQRSHRPRLTDVLVDATLPLEAADVAPELIDTYAGMVDVLQRPSGELVGRMFMMSSPHKSFDLVRFLPVVYDPRPASLSLGPMGRVLAICISCKSTSNVETSVPLQAKVLTPEKLMADAFGDQWSLWKNHAVHVTVCNYSRTDRPTKFVEDTVAEHTIVVCREQFESLYGKSLGELLISAHILHSTKIVR